MNLALRRLRNDQNDDHRIATSASFLAPSQPLKFLSVFSYRCSFHIASKGMRRFLGIFFQEFFVRSIEVQGFLVMARNSDEEALDRRRRK